MARPYMALLALCSSCGVSTSTASSALFVTQANDGDGEVSIAVIVEGGRIAAYACADQVATDPYPGWFIGETSADGHFDLSLDGWSMSGQWSADAAQGTLRETDGTTLSWSGVRAAPSGLTGLYRDDSGRAGVIVIDDETHEPIVRGAYRNVLQVTPVLPLALVDGRLAVDVAAPTPWRMYVAPVRVPPPQ